MIGSSDSNAADSEQGIPPHIEPLFWGTSDLLQWEISTLIEQLEKQKAEAKAKDKRINVSSDPKDIPGVDTIDARGIYGYFPVIIEHDTVVILDPCDFHSELFIVKFKPQWKHLGENIHPDGDIIALSAVTLGPVFSRTVANTELSDGTMAAIGQEIITTLTEKNITEIKRGMSIAENCGATYPVFELLSDPDTGMKRMCEIMSLEERLAMLPGDNGVILPAYSSFSLFSPRFPNKEVIK